MKVCIDLDDYHTFPKWDCTDVLHRLISHYPEMKFTLFLTPFMKNISLYDYPQTLERLKRLVNNGSVEIFLHGYKHTKIINGEFGFLTKRMALKRIEKAMQFLDRGSIPYKRGIKFPWNIYTKGTLKAAEDLRFILFCKKYEKDFNGKQIIWRNHGNLVKRYLNIKCYKRGMPELPKKGNIVYYHGHSQNIGNTGIRESYDYFLSELRELEKIDKLEFIYCSEL